MIQRNHRQMDRHSYAQKTYAQKTYGTQNRGFTVVEVMMGLMLISLSLAAYQTFTLINSRQIILNDGRYRAAVMASNTIEYLMSGACNSSSGSEVYRDVTLDWNGYHGASDHVNDSVSNHSYMLTDRAQVKTFQVQTTVGGEIGIMSNAPDSGDRDSRREVEVYQMARWCSV